MGLEELLVGAVATFPGRLFGKCLDSGGGNGDWGLNSCSRTTLLFSQTWLTSVLSLILLYHLTENKVSD